MFVLLSLLSVLAAALAAALPSLLTTRTQLRGLFLSELVLTLTGVAGCAATAGILLLRLHSAGDEYAGWARDMFAVNAGELLLLTVPILLLTLAAALLTPQRMRGVRRALPPVTAILLLLFTGFLALTSENQGSVPLQLYVEAVGLFLSLTLHARGSLENGRWLRSLRARSEKEADAAIAGVHRRK